MGKDQPRKEPVEYSSMVKGTGFQAAEQGEMRCGQGCGSDESCSTGMPHRSTNHVCHARKDALEPGQGWQPLKQDLERRPLLHVDLYIVDRPATEAVSPAAAGEVEFENDAFSDHVGW